MCSEASGNLSSKWNRGASRLWLHWAIFSAFEPFITWEGAAAARAAFGVGELRLWGSPQSREWGSHWDLETAGGGKGWEFHGLLSFYSLDNKYETLKHRSKGDWTQVKAAFHNLFLMLAVFYIFITLHVYFPELGLSACMVLKCQMWPDRSAANKVQSIFFSMKCTVRWMFNG